jgi:hypothetical protein
MTGNIALDVVIGLVFIYLLYSLFVTTVIEFLATILALRSRNLKAAIQRMLDDEDGKGFADDFYKEPLIKYLGEKNTAIKKFFRIPNRPSYLQARNFSTAVIRLLHKDASSGEFNLGTIRQELENGRLKETQTAQYLLSLLNNSQDKVEKFNENLETWFDDTMERTTGWYKRKAMYLSIIVGIVIAMLFNVDTIQIAQQLSKDPKARAQLIELASQMPKDTLFFRDTTTRELLNAQMGKLISLSDTSTEILSISRNPNMILFPVKLFSGTRGKNAVQSGDHKVTLPDDKNSGQKISGKDKYGFWFDNWSNLWGCLITALALSLGAPFWFDLLNKLVQLRSSLETKRADTEQKKVTE